MLLGDEYYELSLNYRNTVEIANYVNEKIGMIFRPIGFHGDNVRILERDCKDILSKTKNSDNQRMAIIAKNKEYLDAFCEYFDDCYSVLEAKGLEFENVFVLIDDMSENEIYIPCSRALKSLYIIRS